MEYPVFFKRKRLGVVIFNAAMLAVSAAAAIYNIATNGEFWIFTLTAVLFAVTLAFNIFLATEKTYALYSDRIVSLSRFLPKIDIKANELANVVFPAGPNGMLKINYNTDEFDLEKISGGDSSFAEIGEGMWCAYISQKDVDRPLEEVKYLIESIKK